MTTTVTIPIKCSTVNRVKTAIPVVFFWGVVVGSIIEFGWLVHLVTLPGMILSGTNICAVIIIGTALFTISALLLSVSCPYEFKCIKDDKP